MIRMAEALSADFPYARIDLFDCRGTVYFGEITFYHGGAFERFDPPRIRPGLRGPARSSAAHLPELGLPDNVPVL
jgi:hypothetical protein